MNKQEKINYLEKFYRSYDKYITLNDSLTGLRSIDLTKGNNKGSVKITLTQRIYARDKAYNQMWEDLKEIEGITEFNIYLYARFTSIPPKKEKDIANMFGCSLSKVKREVNKALDKLEL
ncbi:MAG: hypothetical protein LUG12_10080 [Erysipelotrichaceae bacterium]|nr:hypothetical protein [Erysipelotrichaceae bacterium]